MNFSTYGIHVPELYQYTCYTKNTPEMDTIITLEIQTLIQEYANDNQLIDLQCNHIFELPSIIKYDACRNPADNYRKSYLIMDFYSYDYKTQQVYKGKDLKGKVILKISDPTVEIKKNIYKFHNFLEKDGLV